MKDALLLFIGFALGAAVVVLVGGKIVSEIQKASVEMQSAIDRVLKAVQKV